MAAVPAQREALQDFQLANPVYAGASITVLEVNPETWKPTQTLAPLYAAPTGSEQRANPQALDGDGKWQQPVYVDRAVVLRITGTKATAPHETGVKGVLGTFRGPWAADELYSSGDIVRDDAAGADTNNLYMATGSHRSSTNWATDLAGGLWALYLRPPADNMRIEELLPVTTAAGGDLLALSTGGVTRRITVSQFQATAPSGPPGPRGLQGFPGPRGLKGDKGDTGSIVQLETIGASTNLGDRPGSATEGDVWLHIKSPAADAYVWTDGAWVNAGPIGASESLPVEGVVYCTASGDDSNSGTSLAQAVATIERAIEVQQGLNYASAIHLYPGSYEWTNSMTVPPGCAVVGLAGQFATNLVCVGDPETNCFLVNSGCYIQGITFRGQRVDDFDNPTTGFAVAFAPGALIFRSPYIRDISQVSNYEAQFIPAPLDAANGNPLQGNGGGVLLADRAVLNPNSTFPYMLAFGATPRSPNGIGYVAKNGAGINGISSISIFARCAFYALNGGQITLNNSGTQFGDLSMRAKGTTTVVVPEQSQGPTAVNNTIAGLIEAAAVSIGNAAWTAMSSVYPTINETFTRRDTQTLLRALALDFRSGDDQSCRVFVLGLFDYKADRVFDPDMVISGGTLLDAFLDGFDIIEGLVRSAVGIAPSTSDMLWGLIKLIKDTLTTPATQTSASLIESLGHQFNLAGAGINANALPLLFRRIGMPLRAADSIVEEDGGVVLWTGADETGASYFPGGLEISGGRIKGPAFTRTVRAAARRAANSRVY